MHEVVDGFLQAKTQQNMVCTCGVDEAHIVLRKTPISQWQQLHAISLRVQSHRRVHGAGEAVKEPTLNAAVFKELPHIL